MRDNQSGLCRLWGFPCVPQFLLAAEWLLLPPWPQASPALALHAAKVGCGMILAPESPPAAPPPHSSRSGAHFLPPQHFLCLQPRQLAGCKSEPGPVWPGFAPPAQRGGRGFRGVGRNYLGSRGNHPGVCSLPALAARCYAFLQTQLLWEGFIPAAQRPCSGQSLCAMPEDGSAEQPPPSAPGVLRNERSAPCLLCNAKTHPNLLYSACSGLQNTCWSWIAGATAPYLADGACKAHPAMLSHGEAEDL